MYAIRSYYDTIQQTDDLVVTLALEAQRLSDVLPVQGLQCDPIVMLVHLVS